MRLTVFQQTAKGLPDKTRDEEEDYPLRDPVVRDLERLKWYLWHGNVFKALQGFCRKFSFGTSLAYNLPLR
jgi:hypothetical protein